MSNSTHAVRALASMSYERAGPSHVQSDQRRNTMHIIALDISVLEPPARRGNKCTIFYPRNYDLTYQPYCSPIQDPLPITTMSHSTSTQTASQLQCQSRQPSQASLLQQPAPSNPNSVFHAAMNAYFDDLAAVQQQRTSTPLTPHVCHGACHGPELWLCRRCATPESIDRYLLSRQPAGVTPVQHIAGAAGHSQTTLTTKRQDGEVKKRKKEVIIR
jgi:hypothetical protein